MGKKFSQGLIAAAEIAVSVYLQNYAGAASAWARAASLASSALLAAGVSGLANLTIGALFGPRRGNPPPLNVTVHGTVEYRRLVFGTVRTGGVLVHYGTNVTRAEDFAFPCVT